MSSGSLPDVQNDACLDEFLPCSHSASGNAFLIFAYGAIIAFGSLSALLLSFSDGGPLHSLFSSIHCFADEQAQRLSLTEAICCLMCFILV